MMEVGGHTPWGPAQTVHHHTDDVVSVTTSRHGGIYVAFNVKQTWPLALRSIETFIPGGLWYEEDLDACLVVIAMPDLFDARAVRECLRGLASWASSSGVGQRFEPFLTWADEHRTKVESIAASWELEHADHWMRRGLSTGGEGWYVWFERVRDGVRAQRIMGDYPEHPVYEELPGEAA